MLFLDRKEYAVMPKNQTPSSVAVGGKCFAEKHREIPLERKSRNLPPEKLHEILCGIYPTEIADEIFEHWAKEEKG